MLGTFPCRRLLRRRAKRRLRQLLVGEEGGGHVLGSSVVVAEWRHVAAGWMVWALRERSEVLARIEMQREGGSVVMSTVACC